MALQAPKTPTHHEVAEVLANPQLTSSVYMKFEFRERLGTVVRQLDLWKTWAEQKFLPSETSQDTKSAVQEEKKPIPKVNLWVELEHRLLDSFDRPSHEFPKNMTAQDVTEILKYVGYKPGSTDFQLLHTHWEQRLPSKRKSTSCLCF